MHLQQKAARITWMYSLYCSVESIENTGLLSCLSTKARHLGRRMEKLGACEYKEACDIMDATTVWLENNTGWIHIQLLL